MRKPLAHPIAFALASLSLFGATTLARADGLIYAQRLANGLVRSHPGMLDAIFHVTPPNSTQNRAIAAYTAKERGARSGPDDIGVMATGKPLVEVQKDGVRIGVLVPLRDRSGRNIGALGLMYAYRKGQDPKASLRRSEAIRDDLSHRIRSREELFKARAMRP